MLTPDTRVTRLEMRLQLVRVARLVTVALLLLEAACSSVLGLPVTSLSLGNISAVSTVSGLGPAVPPPESAEDSNLRGAALEEGPRCLDPGTNTRNFEPDFIGGVSSQTSK